ncbi:MAG: TonB-dependent receptor [Comamonadaceae bacterium PBBC2]|nr:MAG: TonB-dependent receptor [Comamonadaceae bacterium PBBC2]
MKLNKIAHCIALMGVAGYAFGQAVPDQKLQRVEITGSSIKRIASEGALPIQVISSEDLRAQGITTAEQVISMLNVNGNGIDNLASNSDVAAGSGRGSNGLSAANLRGQGASNTLVLLNGRRIAAHGLNGGVVDLSSIPMAAVDRIEVLKDGASAIYGTDAIGGVINFILKKNYQGLQAEAFTDVTQAGGGKIDRVKLVGGFGNLDQDGFNMLVSFGRSQNQQLRGDQRAFVNTFQPNRGLSVDTRGTPFATAFAISSIYNALSRDNLSTTGRSTGPTAPGGGTQTYNGINALDVPGGIGCNAIDGQGAYDEVLWATPAAKYGCAWDTGRAAVLQQPVTNTNLVAKGTFKIGQHQVFAELVSAKAESAKSFSPNQISSSTSATSPLFNLAYPSTGTSYKYVMDKLVGAFPTLAANQAAGAPIAFRWRCMPCGNREIETASNTARTLIGADGPLGGGWDYRAGLSVATSDSASLLGNGYFFGKEFAATINTGLLNPFLLPGETQTPQALAALAAASAKGVTLYGGKSTLQQADATASGPIYKLPAGDVMAAVGIDLRTERFAFNGNATDLATQARVFNAPFDSVNNLDTVQRDVKAVFTEVLIPITKDLETTLAVRRDDYSGFGATTNPKVSFRYTPVPTVLARGAYSTGFRVPTFAQQLFGVTESPYSGKDLVDPAKCAGLVVDTTKPGCESITPTTLFGGKSTLGPETSKQWTLGFVWEPVSSFSAGIDFWSISKANSIQSLSLTTLLNNAALFPANFIRDSNGNLVQIDQRWVNAGESLTTGIDINLRANGRMGDGKWNAVLDGSYLVEKKSRVLTSSPWSNSEIGVFSRTGDLGLRWKHTLTGSYQTGDWTTTLTQIYRSGYKDAVLPGVANGSVKPVDLQQDVEAYSTFNASLTYSGIKNVGLTVGIKNLFDKDPPFTAVYDSDTGAGSSWEPRVADPRGRSLTLLATYKFF